jgi:hypothetical protein
LMNSWLRPTSPIPASTPPSIAAQSPTDTAASVPPTKTKKAVNCLTSKKRQ